MSKLQCQWNTRRLEQVEQVRDRLKDHPAVLVAVVVRLKDHPAVVAVLLVRPQGREPRRPKPHH
jgi:hypothetical protein